MRSKAVTPTHYLFPMPGLIGPFLSHLGVGSMAAFAGVLMMSFVQNIDYESKVWMPLAHLVHCGPSLCVHVIAGRPVSPTPRRNML